MNHIAIKQNDEVILFYQFDKFKPEEFKECLYNLVYDLEGETKIQYDVNYGDSIRYSGDISIEVPEGVDKKRMLNMSIYRQVVNAISNGRIKKITLKKGTIIKIDGVPFVLAEDALVIGNTNNLGLLRWD